MDYADVQEIKQKGMSKTAKILIVSGIVVPLLVWESLSLALRKVALIVKCCA